MLDAIFGGPNYRNEISWKRSQPKSHNTVNFTNCRDVILRYSKGETVTFNKVFGEYDPLYIEKFYRFTDDDGRQYQLADLTNPNKNRPNLTYEFLGLTRVWRWTRDRMERAYKDGLIHQSQPGAVPRLKRYLDEMQGQPVTDDWDDIEHLHGSSGESLGYPTQKHLALLERIIQASSNEGDLVLDPFCGCGTTVHAAEKLRRQWAGIDITHLAISLIEKRLRDAFPGITFDVHGTPKDLESARALAAQDKYQFQWWAVSLDNHRVVTNPMEPRGVIGIWDEERGRYTAFRARASTPPATIQPVRSGCLRRRLGSLPRMSAAASAPRISSIPSTC